MRGAARYGRKARRCACASGRERSAGRREHDGGPALHRVASSGGILGRVERHPDALRLAGFGARPVALARLRLSAFSALVVAAPSKHANPPVPQLSVWHFGGGVAAPVAAPLVRPGERTNSPRYASS